MSLRKRGLFAAAALLGVAVALLPAIAASEAPTISAVNEGYSHRWSPSQASVGAGQAVAFSNPGEVPHGIEWVGGPEKPSCSAGVPVGTTEAVSGTKWSGTCAFLKPGTYTFYCTVHHAEMTGTVIVGETAPPGTTAPGGTTTSGSPPAAPETGSLQLVPTPAAQGSPLAGGDAVRVAPRQRGGAVRGRVSVAAAGARGRLEVQLLAAPAALAARGRARVRVGRLVRSSLPDGTVRFSVPLSARGRSALRRRGRLALLVRVVLVGPSGATAHVTRAVLLRR